MGEKEQIELVELLNRLACLCKKLILRLAEQESVKEFVCEFNDICKSELIEKGE